jgi:LemA protein
MTGTLNNLLSNPVFLLLAFVLLFVMLVSWLINSKNNNVLNALADIDVQLKKRHDLIPNLLTIAKKFMEHETELFSTITELRASATKPYDPNNNEELKAHVDVQNKLQNNLSQMMLNVENYPTLKSDQNMILVQKTYNEVEEFISASRRFYNSSVNSFNSFVESFPINIIASLMNKKSKPFFEATEEDKKEISADKFL